MLGTLGVGNDELACDVSASGLSRGLTWGCVYKFDRCKRDPVEVHQHLHHPKVPYIAIPTTIHR